jgi:hypothetical protein
MGKSVITRETKIAIATFRSDTIRKGVIRRDNNWVRSGECTRQYSGLVRVGICELVAEDS